MDRKTAKEFVKAFREYHTVRLKWLKMLEKHQGLKPQN